MAKNGHNHEYTNKTSKGYNLSIKNGIAYLNGKIASAGYKWYDGNNGNTYKTVGKGKYKLISTEEGPVKHTKIRTVEEALQHSRETGGGNDRHYLYQDLGGRYILEGIDSLDRTGRDKLYEYRMNFVDDRLNKEENYAIPQHLPGVKRRTLSSGRYKGVKVYDNTLEEIYNNAVKNNISFEELLGLAAETSLGRDRHMTMNETREDYNRAKKYPYYNATQNGRYVLFPSDMLNNHNYYVGNNATGTINTLIAQGKIPGIKSFADGQPFPIIGMTLPKNRNNPYNRVELTDSQNKIIDAEVEKVLRSKEKSSDDPWTNAIDFYRKYNYGMGKNYPDTVRNRGKELINTPEIQSWYRRRLESNGKLSK